MGNLNKDLKDYKEKFEKLQKESDDKISALEEKNVSLQAQVEKLNELLDQSDEGKAKLILRQVMTTVPLLLVKILFPQKKPS